MRKTGKAGNKKSPSGSSEKLKNKGYQRVLFRLHVELVKLQERVKSTGAKMCIVFEGRDGAGKGGTIPYKEMRRPKVKLPSRQKPDGYAEPNYPYKAIPEVF